MGFNNKDEALKRALAGEISTYIQPIVNSKTNNIEGWEMLTRGPSGSKLEMPNKLFSYAKRKKKVRQLEFACINNSLNAVETLNSNSKAFINISSPMFCKNIGVIADYAKNISSCSIVLELTESHKSNITELIVAANWYRSKGISIAVDDVSSGYDRLKSILYIKPEYFKLERDLIKDCHNDIDKRNMIKSLLLMGDKLGSKVIAEGVETNEELFTLREIGLELCQGFIFSKPFPVKSFCEFNLINII